MGAYAPRFCVLRSYLAFLRIWAIVVFDQAVRAHLPFAICDWRLAIGDPLFFASAPSVVCFPHA